MNRYTNLITTNITSMEKLNFLNRIQLEPEEFERILIKIKSRILNEIGALDCPEFGQTDYSKQMELIYELRETGFNAEALSCLKIMQERIHELAPEMQNWFRLHMAHLEMPEVLTKHSTIANKIFIETFDEFNNLFNVTWCIDGNQNDIDPQWKDSAILSTDLLEFARQSGLNNIVLDSCDHTGHHIQQEIKAPLFQYVDENIETFIKSYIQKGWPRVDLN